MKAIIVLEDSHKGPVPALPEGATCELHLFENIIELGQAAKVRRHSKLHEAIGRCLISA